MRRLSYVCGCLREYSRDLISCFANIEGVRLITYGYNLQRGCWRSQSHLGNEAQSELRTDFLPTRSRTKGSESWSSRSWRLRILAPKIWTSWHGSRNPRWCNSRLVCGNKPSGIGGACITTPCGFSSQLSSRSCLDPFFGTWNETSDPTKCTKCDGWIKASVLFLGINHASSVQTNILCGNIGTLSKTRRRDVCASTICTRASVNWNHLCFMQTVVYGVITYAMIHCEWKAIKFFVVSPFHVPHFHVFHILRHGGCTVNPQPAAHGRDFIGF